MEINNKKNILQKEKENLINTLNMLFTNNPSSYGYKHDIEELLKEFQITEEEFFNVVLESFTKEKRNNEDQIFITSYLFFMQEFIKILKTKESYKKETKLINFLRHLSMDIFYMQTPKEMILMKYGDKGDKAYINLKGDVDVLIPNSKLMNVNENDYLLYLASLIEYKEYNLINLVLNDNFPNYPLILYDDLSSNLEIPSIFENIKKSKKKLTTFIKGKDNEITKTLLDIDKVINNLKQKLLKNRKRFQGIKTNSNYNDDIKINQTEEQNENNSLQKEFKLNSTNEELALSLELYIISSKQLLNLFDFLYYNDNDDEVINCSSDKYINRMNVPNLKEKSNNISLKDTSINSFYQLNIYFYSKVISLGKGHLFGELALRDPKAERTATIITTTECHFAYLNRKTYNNSLKTNTELHLKNQLTFFVNLPIFVDIPIILFYKKYYTHISKHYLMKNKFVIKQGEKPTQLCLLNKGNYELICNMNLRELTDLIYYFIEKVKNYQINSEQNDLNYYNEILISLRKNDEKQKALLKKNSNFQKLFTKENLMKISEMSCPDISGFEEIIGKDGVYAFSLQAKTMENIIYTLEFNFYKELYNKNPLIQKRHNYIIKIKLDFIIKRLFKIRNNIISSFFNHKTEDDISSIVSKEIEKLNKQKKIGKRFLNLKNTKLNLDNKNNISFDIRDYNNNIKNLFTKKFNNYRHSKIMFKNEIINFSNQYSTRVLNNNKAKGEKIIYETSRSNSFESKNVKKKMKKDLLNKTSNNFFANENLTYMNLVPIIKLRKSYKLKPIKIKQKKERTFTENNNLLKGKKINKSIQCFFDKKIKIADSLNFTEKIKKKRKLLKLENLKLNLILLKNKEKILKNIYNRSRDKKRKNKINNDKLDYFSFDRSLRSKNINLNMLVLTNRSINLTNRDSFFNNKIEKLIKIPKITENKKEKIEEILKENDDNNNISDLINKSDRAYIYKRDDYYKKNLMRIKFFYGK